MEFERTVLPGGTTVITERMDGIRSVALGFWVGAGARDEPAKIQGASHFLEHVLFKGSAAYSAREIAEAFDEVGGEANAFSAKEFTCFHARVLDKDLPMATNVLSDMLRKPAIRPADVSGERNVILEEISMHEDTPEDLVHDLFTETVFGSHPLGREVMGTTATVGSIKAADLKEFHRGHYRSKNIVVAAAGGVDHGELVKLVSDEFSSGEGISIERVAPPSEPAAKLSVVTRTTEQAHVLVGGIGYSRDHPDRFAWGVLDTLLGSGASSRLFQQIREKLSLAYSVFSYRNTFSEIGTWAVYAGTSPGNVFQLLEVIDTELDRLANDGVTLKELNRSKGSTRGGIVMALEEPSSRMTRLGKSELLGSEMLSIDEIIERVEAVELSDVARVAQDLLAQEKRVLTMIGPFSAQEVTERAEIAAEAIA